MPLTHIVLEEQDSPLWITQPTRFQLMKEEIGQVWGISLTPPPDTQYLIKKFQHGILRGHPAYITFDSAVMAELFIQSDLNEENKKTARPAEILEADPSDPNGMSERLDMPDMLVLRHSIATVNCICCNKLLTKKLILQEKASGKIFAGLGCLDCGCVRPMFPID